MAFKTVLAIKAVWRWKDAYLYKKEDESDF